MGCDFFGMIGVVGAVVACAAIVSVDPGVEEGSETNAAVEELAAVVSRSEGGSAPGE